MAPHSCRAAWNGAPASRSSFASRKLPEPMTPKTASTPPATRLRATTRATLIRTPRSCGERSACAVRVVVEPSAGLLPEMTGRDEVAQDLGRSEARAELLLQVLGDREAHVEADEVAETQRPHRMSVAELHRPVDVGGRGHSLLEHASGLEPEQDPEPARREAGDVLDDDRLLAERDGELARTLDDAGIRGPSAYDLDQGHGEGRVEEVHSDDPPASGEVAGDGTDGERARVRGDDRASREALVERCDDRLLQLEPLGHGLDGDVGCAPVIGTQARMSRRRLLGRDPPAGSGSPEGFRGRSDGPLGERLVRIGELHVVPVQCEQLRDAASHRPRSDDDRAHSAALERGARRVGDGGATAVGDVDARDAATDGLVAGVRHREAVAQRRASDVLDADVHLDDVAEPDPPGPASLGRDPWHCAEELDDTELAEKLDLGIDEPVEDGLKADAPRGIAVVPGDAAARPHRPGGYLDSQISFNY